MVNRLISYLGRPPHVLHRLDMNTSGVVLFGKRPGVVPHVHRQFRERHVRKRYLALTVSVPADAAFSVDQPIGRHPTTK
jgi:23S rRNA pseudouridine1911/1915/1917 synthase